MPTHIAFTIALVLSVIAVVLSTAALAYNLGRHSMEKELTEEVPLKQLSGVSWEDFDAGIRIHYEQGILKSVKLKKRTTEKVL